ncbi:MAG: hypothetical protein IJX98_03695 [Clostridia bacterium]|nr:hypothetical protein [Clostridia bacterium]
MAKRERKEKPKKKGGFLGKLVSLLLGFILGVVSTLGGIVGLGYVLVSQVTVKDAVNTANDLTGANINYLDYITEEYANNSILGLVGVIGEVAADFSSGEGSFEDLEKISPMVRTGVEEMAKSLSDFGVNVEVDSLMKTKISELGTFLQNTVNGIELATMLEKATGNPATGIIALLCYGEEGVNYVVETNEETGEQTIRMLGDNAPTTISSLTGENGIADLLNDISFASLLESAGGANASDSIMRALLYGVENEDYIYDEETQTVTPLPLSYGFDNEKFTDKDGNEYIKADGSTVWTNENGYTISAVTEAGSVYQYEVTKDSAVIYKLSTQNTAEAAPATLSTETTAYYAYIDDVLQYRRGLLIGDLLGEGDGITGAIGGLRLADLLGVDESTDDTILKTLCFGEDGETPVTLGDLLNNNINFTDLVNGLALADVLGIESPLATDVESLMIILAYGEENTHWQKAENEDGWEFIGENTKRTIKDLTDSEADLFNSISLAAILGITKEDGADKMMLALAFGEKGINYAFDGTFQMLSKKYYLVNGTEVYDQTNTKVGTANTATDPYTFTTSGETPITKYLVSDGEDGYYAYATAEDAVTGNNPETHAKTTVGDLQSGITDKINNITLASVLDIDLFSTPAPDALMAALAFGNEGTHYALDTKNKTIEWNTMTDKAPLKYRARTIADMQNAGDLINEIYLDVALQLNASSPGVLLSLAYEEYSIVNGEIVADNEHRRTVSALTGSNGASLINEIELKSIMTNIKTDDKIMMFFAYGQDGVHWTDSNGDGTPEMLQMQFATKNGKAYDVYGNELPNSQVTTQSGITGIAFGSDVNDLQKYALVGTTGRTVKIDGEEIDLYYAHTTDGTSLTKAYYSPRTVGEWSDENSTAMNDMMKALTIADCIGEEAANSSSILKHLSTYPIGELADKMETLSIQEVMTDDVYELQHFEVSNGIYTRVSEQTGTSKQMYSYAVVTTNSDSTTLSYTYYPLERVESPIYDTDGTTVIGYYYTYKFIENNYPAGYTTETPVAIKKGDQTVATVYTYTGDGVSALTPTALNGTWKYLLIESDTKVERSYSLSNMDLAIRNMTSNIQSATLNELHQDGVMDFSESDAGHKDFRSHEITYTITLQLGLVAKVYAVSYDDHNENNEFDEGEEILTWDDKNNNGYYDYTHGETVLTWNDADGDGVYDEGDTIHYYEYADGTVKWKIGELTVAELMDYAGDMINFLDNLSVVSQNG